MISKQLIILAGGKGTRLGAATKTAPKPLMQITENQVFLDFFLKSAVPQGFERVLMIAGYLGDQIKDRYDGQTRFGAKIDVVIEPEAMGTGGALVFAKDLLEETFIVANGDTLFDIDMKAVDRALHAHAAAEGVLALRHVENVSRYGSVVLNDAGQIEAFLEKDLSGSSGPGLINGGIYALRRSVVEKMTSLPASIETDLFPQLAASKALMGVPSEGYFLDIGLPETLDQARRELPVQFA